VIARTRDAELFLEGKRAVVTGASRGLGRGIAISLARAGADVAVGYRRDRRAAEEVAAEIRAVARRATVRSVELGDQERCKGFIDSAIANLGSIDIFVANAAEQHFAAVVDFDPLEWSHDIDVNVKGTFFCAQEVARHMVREQIGGSIVFISSSAVTLAGPQTVSAAASKGAVEGIARTMAVELGPRGIRVNVVAPGPAGPTDMNRGYLASPGAMKATIDSIPLGRLAAAEDVGAAVCFLASDEASYISGARVAIDGGFTVSKSQVGVE
jgi:NAD(P)-dependent dehydrogenase (short-subunit alcohol dehydrogenase family)